MTTSLTVRNLDEDLVRRLKIRAAENGRSAEAEHREILRAALAAEAGDFIEAARRFRAKIAGRPHPSAVDLIRESREER